MAVWRFLPHNLLYVEKLTFANISPNDLESNIRVDIREGPSICETNTVRLEPQYDLAILGVGASGQATM